MQHAARLVERRVLLNELLTRRLLVLHVLLLMLRNLLLLLLRLDQAGEPRAAGQAVIARTRRCRAVDTVDTGHARRARAERGVGLHQGGRGSPKKYNWVTAAAANPLVRRWTES